MAVALQAHLPSVTDLCVHAGIDPLELDPEWLPEIAQMDQVCSPCAHSTCADCAPSMSLSRMHARTHSFMPNYARACTAGLVLLSALTGRPALPQELVPACLPASMPAYVLQRTVLC